MDRDCITDAFVLPVDKEPLIGAVPIELMVLGKIPAESKLSCNPAHPECHFILSNKKVPGCPYII